MNADIDADLVKNGAEDAGDRKTLKGRGLDGRVIVGFFFGCAKGRIGCFDKYLSTFCTLITSKDFSTSTWVVEKNLSGFEERLGCRTHKRIN